MVIKRYCFLGSEYIGNLIIDTDKNDKHMEYLPDKKLSDRAKMWKQMLPMNTTRLVDLFISERVIPDGRPEKSLVLSMIGLSPRASDLEIFLAEHSVGNNDLFWTSETLDNSWYFTSGLGDRFK